MSAKLKHVIEIVVTDGDALQENKIIKDDGSIGKSNTGTYFLCSLKDFSEYEPLFVICEEYYFYPKGMMEYKLMLNEHYSYLKSKYKNSMDNFEKNCNDLINADHLYTDITFRKNDTRVFFRFKDNKNDAVKKFRKTLYGDNSMIVLEFVDRTCRIYAKFIDDDIILD